MPPPLRPDQLVRVAANAHRIGVRLDIRDHLDIVEIGKDQIAAALEFMEAEPAPEIHQTPLRMSVKPSIAFHLAKLDGGPDQLE